MNAHTFTHSKKKGIVVMTNMPFKRTRIHEGAGGILMSHSTVGHYQLIYPQELSLLDNSITVAQAHREFKNKKQEHGQICDCTDSAFLIYQ